MEPLAVGSAAPAFSAPDQDGNLVSLADFRGRSLVLYFYPKDDTPGCTVQACSFRDEYSSFIDKGSAVVGVSPDTAQSHTKFIKKFSLPFPLLSDLTHKVAQDYGVWVEKSMYGRKYMGMERTTFVIDGQGIITAIHRKVKPADHVLELLAAF
jgi:peroxiredoxin Q/BCP